ncbi:MAG: hypothetical protein JWN75_92 [Candidatus Saccharibacteria bacterium]|nr:hypothetical protein [Candidatus Saccharibacteria bacterium]
MDREPPQSIPLSPDVVRQFLHVCGNLSRYGISVQSRELVLHELDIVDNKLKINSDPLMSEVTHQSSGITVAQEEKPGLEKHVNIWTPLEKKQPKTVTILSQVGTLSTVTLDFLKLQTGTDEIMTEGYRRNIITTQEKRMYQLFPDWVEHDNEPVVDELTADSQVVRLINHYKAIADIYRSDHPEA